MTADEEDICMWVLICETTAGGGCCGSGAQMLERLPPRLAVSVWLLIPSNDDDDSSEYQSSQSL